MSLLPTERNCESRPVVKVGLQTSFSDPAGSQPRKGGSCARLRVLFITRDFPPVSHSGTIRSEGFARYLPEFGIEPVVFTSDPQYASRIASLDHTQIANWCDDPRWPAVYRVPWMSQARAAGKGCGIWKRLPLANILASQAERGRLVAALLPAAREAIRTHGVQAIYASAMPSETVLLATELGSNFGLPVIADLRDPWTYQPNFPYRHLVDFWLERRLERRTLARCSRVIVNTRQTQRLLEEKLGVPRSKLRLIRNGYDEADFPSQASSPAPLEPGRFVILHAGQLSTGATRPRTWPQRIKTLLSVDVEPLHIDSAARSPVYVLKALEALLERRPEARERLRLWLVGMNNAADCEAIRRFRFPDCLQVQARVDSAAAAEMTCRADLLLLLQFQYFLRGRDCCVAIPAKLYTYLRSGRRILACVQPSEIAELVREHQAGRIVPPDDPEAIAAAIWAEYEAWRAAPASTVHPRRELPQYDRRQLAGDLADVLYGCVKEHSPSSYVHNIG